MASDILQEVPEEDIPGVLTKLKNEGDWPRNFILHQLVSVLGVYKKANTRFRHRLYLHGDFVTGVYLNRISMELPDREENIFFVFTSDPDLSALRHSLTNTHVVPWHTATVQFIMTHERFYPVVCQVFEVKGVEFVPVPNHILWLPPSVDLPLTGLPEDVYLDFLNENHVSQVDTNWAHRFPGSDILVREHILRNFGLGLFRKSDNRMLSSAVSNFSGGIVLLFSDPEFRGRGYAGIIIEQMTKAIRERGWISYCTVVIGNTPSEKLFNKYKFEEFTPSTWLISKRNVD